MITDLHTHSTFSIDSRATPEQIIQEARLRGINILAITDHADFAEGDSRFNPSEYIPAINALREEADGITILCGVELGIQAEHAEPCRKFLGEHSFDFIIGSMHRARVMDLYNGEFYEGRTINECWQIYLEESLKAFELCSNFDVMGHPDIIRRYHLTRNSRMPDECADRLDAMLKWLVANGKGLELNTSGLRYGLDSMHPSDSILRRFHELGGEIVTIGSDSHKAETLAADYDLAVAVLKKNGFKHHAWFKNRVAHFAEL